MHGPYEPLNGSGLVVANPPEQPDQAYAWLVLPDLRVCQLRQHYLTTSGADLRHADADVARARFAGTPAPDLTLALAGNRATLVDADCSYPAAVAGSLEPAPRNLVGQNEMRVDPHTVPKSSLAAMS